MTDLTTEEQANVRTALRFLRVRAGGWEPVARALHFDPSLLGKVTSGRTVTASMAVRVARLAHVGVDDVLTGRYPNPNACPHCGQVSVPAAALPASEPAK